MKFTFTPQAKKFILNNDRQITVGMELEVCNVCSGKVEFPQLSIRLGKPEADEYRLVSEDEINIYVSKALEKLDKTATLAIDLTGSTLVIYGVVSES